jgi:hypothetical protein
MKVKPMATSDPELKASLRGRRLKKWKETGESDMLKVIFNQFVERNNQNRW